MAHFHPTAKAVGFPVRRIVIESPLSDKEVSIGAGAKINQKLPEDTWALDSWKETPDSVMTVYFVFQDVFDKMKADGMRDLVGSKEGMLAGVLVG